MKNARGDDNNSCNSVNFQAGTFRFCMEVDLDDDDDDDDADADDDDDDNNDYRCRPGLFLYICKKGSKCQPVHHPDQKKRKISK